MSRARTLVKETINKVGEEVTLAGWVWRRRDHGKLIFLDLRDATGVIQSVSVPQKNRHHQEAGRIKEGWVVKLIGYVKKRPEGMINQELATGEVELTISSLEVLSESRDLPFPVDDDGYQIKEDLRLRYRYLDLRRPRLQQNLKLRALAMSAVRDILVGKGFLEIETPLLTKSTPEGARDFLVPSRLQAGSFYALPQSPQQYKQLLMVAGFERYFQFPRVFRDEDLRADRLFEHTQMDIEMSFTSEEEIFGLIEEVAEKVSKVVVGVKPSKLPFARLSFAEVMKRYNSDKPDLRKNKKDKRELSYLWVTEFPMFEKKEDGSLGAVHHPFTGIYPDDVGLLWSKKESDWLKVRARQYDLVLNGYEVMGGSIRTTDSKILKRVFEILGHSAKEIEHKFGHLLEAFSYGVPPHGGIASGFDRWLQALLGETSIREVIAFPTATSGRTAVMDAPGLVEAEQLKELGIKTIKKSSSGKK